MVDGDMVYVVACSSGGRTQTYHTDPDCQSLQLARKVHTYPRSSVADRRSECKRCAGETVRKAATDYSFHNALRDADPESIP